MPLRHLLRLTLGVVLAGAPCASQSALTPPASDWPLSFTTLAASGLPTGERTGGPDAFGYAFEDSTEPGGPNYGWVNIAATGTVATSAMADDGSELVALPFPFNFYGTVHSSVRIHSNGYLDFDGLAPEEEGQFNRTIPSQFGANNIAAVLWHDFDASPAASPGASVRYRDMGDGRFVVSWLNVRSACGQPPPVGGCTGAPQSFQVILRANHSLKFQYQSVSDTPTTQSTIGVEGPLGAVGLLASYNESPAYVASGLAINVTPPSPIPAADVAFSSAGVSGEQVDPLRNDDVDAKSLMRLNITLTGTVGTLPLTSITFSVSGTAPSAGISLVRIFDFATFEDIAVVPNPNGTYTVPVTRSLVGGLNGFSFIFRANAAAPVGSTITGTVTSVTVDGTAYAVSPSGGLGVLTVVESPVNDDFADALPLQRSLLTEGTNLYATEESVFLESASCTENGLGGFHSVWYTYVPPADGHVTFNTFGSEVGNTVLSIHTGPSSSLTEVACNDDALLNGEPSLHSEVASVAVQAGTTYRIRVASAESGGSGSTQGSFRLSYVPLDFVQPYTITQPLAGERWALGDKEKVKWSGPGVPDSGVDVDVYARDGNGGWIPAVETRNRGSIGWRLPDTLTPSADYTVAVQSRVVRTDLAVSAPFTIYDPDNAFVFTNPLERQYLARGQDQTFTWTSPEGAGPFVLIELYRAGVELFSDSAPNTGSYTFPVPPTHPLGGHTLQIQDLDNPSLFFTESDRFTISRFQVDAPGAGTVWEAGSQQTVSWSGTGPNPAGEVKVLFKRNGFPNVVLANNVPFGDGSVQVTVPAVDPSDDYYLALVYEIGVQNPIVVPTLTFSVVGPPVAPAPADGLLPVGVEDWTELAVSGLADGTDLAAYVAGVRLGAGRVSAGEATIWLPATFLAADGEETALDPTAEITLVAVADGVETPVEVATVTRGTTGEAAPLALAAGDVLFVDATLGAADGALPTEFAIERVAPNPFGGAATVRVALPEASALRLVAYDALGRQVAVLLDGTFEAGRHAVRFDASGLAAGVYVLRMEAGGTSSVQRVTVAR